MAYRLGMSERVDEGLARIAVEQIAQARRDIAGGDTVKGIHKLRQRCKRLRAIVRLARPALGRHYARENRRFRDLARRVGGLRDEQILVDTFDALMAAHKGQVDRRRFTPTRQQLLARHHQALKATALPDKALIDAELARAHAALADWTPAVKRFRPLRDGLIETCRQARRAMGQAEHSGEETDFHEWRKQVKYHRHHCELLVNVWKVPMAARAEEAHRLADLLGEAHDLALLAQALMAPEMVQGDQNTQALLAMIATRRATLQAQALLLGHRLFADSPEALGRRISRYRRIARRAARDSAMTS